jgi:RNA polymerase sigma-70 factor (ECF subfamily)
MEQPPASNEEDPQDVTDQHGLQQAVRDAIAGLPPRYREIITLQVFGELTYEEIARTLKMPLGTVMWRLNMAKRLLRKQLQSTEDAESA